MDNIKFEDIQRANETIHTTNIKGKEYAEVNQRIKAFRMVYPQGTISTEILTVENGVVIMKATVLNEKGEALATGTAYEKEDSSFINKTSYIENCETSAIGRALGIAGFGIDTSVASAEEVQNAINNQNKEKNEINIEAKLGFGTKHKEHTWVQVYFTDPTYFDWLIENAKDEEGANIYRTIRDTIASREDEIKKEKGVE